MPSTITYDGTSDDVGDGQTYSDYGSVTTTSATTFAGTVDGEDVTGTFSYTKNGPNTAGRSYTATTSGPGYWYSESGTFNLTFTSASGGTYTASGSYQGNFYGVPFSGSFINGVGTFFYSAPRPAIEVILSGGASIPNGGYEDFGSVGVGFGSALIFTILNNGDASLTGLVITKSGPNDADFTPGAPFATTLAPGASTTFTVAFAPGASGLREATLHIASNDADDNPFDIYLSGMGVGPNTAVAEAIDQPGVDVTDGGDGTWFSQAAVTHDGIDAARSGDIAGDDESSFSLVATGPGIVSFWWKVSSEEDYDILSFHIDGVKQSGEISGEVGWQQMAYTLAAGSHTLQWTYSKDYITSRGDDCAWVDQVVLSTGQAILPIVTLFNTGVSTNGADGNPSTMTADGIPDQHYEIVASPNGIDHPFVTVSESYPFPEWSENTPESKWISPRATYAGDLQDPVGTYTFITTFNLSGFDVNSVYISGSLTADNNVEDIRINGVSIAFSIQGSSGFDLVPVTIPGGHYLPGINTLEFDVFNDTPSGGNPTGLRVELSGVASALFPVNSIEMWRVTHFGDAGDSGDGANFNDFDRDGISNLLEYAFGLDPTRNSAGLLPRPEMVGGNLVMTFTQPVEVTGITYGAEWSGTLLPGTWTEIPNTGTAPQHVFSVPTAGNPKVFMRWKITVP